MTKWHTFAGAMVIISSTAALMAATFFFTPPVNETIWGILPLFGKLMLGVFFLGMLVLILFIHRRGAPVSVAVNRPKCPFYGFSIAAGMMVDESTDTCALACVGKNTPCIMEKNGQSPNWNTCRVNMSDNRLAIAYILDATRTFPREFRPPGGKHWHGIKTRRWFNLVMET